MTAHKTYPTHYRDAFGRKREYVVNIPKAEQTREELLELIVDFAHAAEVMLFGAPSNHPDPWHYSGRSGAALLIECITRTEEVLTR